MSWATVRAIALVIFALAGMLSCADTDEPAEMRLIEASDPDYVDLETPETVGECTTDTNCEQSCVHSCAPIPVGPVTCPSTPPPVPDRVVSASCTCFEQVCAWF